MLTKILLDEVLDEDMDQIKSVMSMSVDSCSTSSGCVSDLDNLSEDNPSPEAPDSPVSSTESVHSNTAIKSLPNDINKELIISETLLSVKQLDEDVTEEVDEGVVDEELVDEGVVDEELVDEGVVDEELVDEGLIEEELIESEIIIDCSPIDSIDNLLQPPVLTDDCFPQDFKSRVEDNENSRNEMTDCYQSFNTSFDCGSSISSSCSKAETASIKSDTSGLESDHRLDISRTTGALNKTAVNSHLINGIFKEVNKCLPKKSEEIRNNCNKSSNNCNNSYICKWTHCDWPGSYDDLVDHIREIHVELQPYQQQKHNWNELNSKTKIINKITINSKTKQMDNNLNICVNNAKKVESTQQYVCLWEGCKVYGKPSLSRNWLERHVLEQHSGPRPFKCIVEGCGARFKVQSALERHVNSHFKPSVDCSNSNCSSDVTNCCSTSSAPIPNTTCCANSDSNSCSIQGLSPFELHIQSSRATMSAVRCKSALDSNQHFCGALNGSNGTPNKILKRKKSATKLRRKCFYVKSSEDFFDECVMEQIRYGLIQLNAQTGLDITGNQSTITFHSRVIARRENDRGEVNVLLKWEPIDILPDVWVSEAQVEELKYKTVPVSTLPADSLAQLIENNTGFERKPKTKQRRK